MFTPLRVLVVEDSADDTLLVLLELQHGGYNPEFQRVDNAATLTAALDAQTWDVIVSDYSIPGFGGPEALAVCQRKNIDTPFILVSGRIGEETAVEIMRAGAHDCVMKDNLTRLVPIIKREMRAAEERRIRRQAEITTAHLAAIVESCEDAIVSEALDGTILSWNAGAERVFGYTAAEMLGQSVSRLVPPNQADDLLDIFNRLRRDGSVKHFEAVRVRKDGQHIDVSVTVSPIKGPDGRVRGASIVTRDVTLHKQQEMERLELIHELSDALARVKTLNGLLPICASCKKIRDDNGYWEQVEIYIRNHSDADFTHGICPECRNKLYPEFSLAG